MRPRSRHLRSSALKVEECQDIPGRYRIFTTESVPRLTSRSINRLRRTLEATKVCRVVNDKGKTEDGKRILLEYELCDVNRRRGAAIVGRTLRSTRRIYVMSEHRALPKGDYEETNRRSSRHAAFLPAPAR